MYQQYQISHKEITMSSTPTLFGLSRPYLDIYDAWSKIKSAYEITGSYRDPISKLENRGADDALFDHYVDQAICAIGKKDRAGLLFCTSKLSGIIEENRSYCLLAIDEHTASVDSFIRLRKKEIQDLAHLLDLCESKLQALDLGSYKMLEALNDLDSLERSIDTETRDASQSIKQRINNHFNRVQMAVNQLLDA
jgi:hypothetical protein